jgi:hypothetical protein
VNVWKSEMAVGFQKMKMIPPSGISLLYEQKYQNLKNN